MQPDVPRSSPSFFWIIFVLFLIISVIIVAGIYITKGIDAGGLSSLFNRQKEEVIVYNTTLYNVSFLTNANQDYFFRITENNTLVAEGLASPEHELTYSNGQINKTYVFEVWKNRSIYYNKIECFVDSNRDCELSLKPIGNYSLNFSNNKLYLEHRKEGYLQKPLICIAWTFDIYLVSIQGYPKTQIPKTYRHLVDVCYDLGQDFATSSSFDIAVQRVNAKVSRITFYLIDRDANKEGIMTYEDDYGMKNIKLEVDI